MQISILCRLPVSLDDDARFTACKSSECWHKCWLMPLLKLVFRFEKCMLRQVTRYMDDVCIVLKGKLSWFMLGMFISIYFLVYLCVCVVYFSFLFVNRRPYYYCRG